MALAGLTFLYHNFFFNKRFFPRNKNNNNNEIYGLHINFIIYKTWSLFKFI